MEWKKEDLLVDDKIEEYKKTAKKIAEQIDSVEKAYALLNQANEHGKISSGIEEISVIIDNFTYRKQGNNRVYGESNNQIGGGLTCNIYTSMQDSKVGVYTHYKDEDGIEFAGLNYIYDNEKAEITEISAMGTKEIKEKEGIDIADVTEER